MTLYCDVDGTLLDSSARHEKLLRDLLAARGLRWLFTIPCLVSLAADCFACAWRRAERQKPEVRARRSVIICVFVLLTGTVAECALVPRLFAWLMAGLT